MRPGISDMGESREDRGRAMLQFLLQVGPFVQQLSPGFFHLRGPRRPQNSGPIETIAARFRFIGNPMEKRGDRFQGRNVILETRQLRMPGIAARPAADYFLSQQRFPPGRDQPRRVEITRMQSPKSHAR